MAAQEGQFQFRRPNRGEAPSATYVNGASIFYSSWDFVLLFEQSFPVEARDGDDDHRVHTEVVQRIVMSPEHAKILVTQLRHNVELYEQEFGEIPGPPDEADEEEENA